MFKKLEVWDWCAQSETHLDLVFKVSLIQTVLLHRSETSKKKYANSSCGSNSGRIEPHYMWYDKSKQEGGVHKHDTCIDRSHR